MFVLLNSVGRGGVKPLGFIILYNLYQLCAMMPSTVMDADSGKSQDNHTCGMTNALPGHTLTFACFICLYVVFMVQVLKPSETMSF